MGLWRESGSTCRLLVTFGAYGIACRAAQIVREVMVRVFEELQELGRGTLNHKNALTSADGLQSAKGCERTSECVQALRRTGTESVVRFETLRASTRRAESRRALEAHNGNGMSQGQRSPG